MAVSKKLTRESFQKLYPTPSEAFSRQVTDMLQHLPTEQREGPVRRKLAVGLILAFALMMATFTALAAALDWNVLAFLFGDQEHAAKALVQQVDMRASNGQVTLSVNSAMTDGENLAMDWTLVNEQPDQPVYILVEEFTINGEEVSTDGNNEFDDCWLPGPFGQEGRMQDGEIIKLPQTLRAAEQLNIVLRASVYNARQPIYIMDTYDAALAEEKIQEGYLVVPEGEGYVERDADGVYWAAGPNPANLPRHFTRTELEIAFTLSSKAGRASVQHLKTEKQYANEHFTARYTQAEVSPIGLTLQLEVEAPDAIYDFELTDGQGNRLGANLLGPVNEIITTGNGDCIQIAKSTWYGLTQEMLPDVIALTCFPDKEEPIILPVQAR